MHQLHITHLKLCSTFLFLLCHTEIIVIANNDEAQEGRFYIQDSNWHVINFNDNWYKYNSCLNHLHFPPNPKSSKGYMGYYGPSNNFIIKPNTRSKCFVIYNEHDCRGARMEFIDAKPETSIMFDLSARQLHEMDVFANFKISPKSLSQCLPLENPGENLAQGINLCASNYGIRLGISNPLKTTQTCTNIPEGLYHAERSIHILFDNKSEFYPYICLETFSRLDCEGGLIRFIVDDVTQSSLEIQNESLQMWRFNRDQRTGNPIIDTDVRSVRHCPCPPKPINQTNVDGFSPPLPTPTVPKTTTNVPFSTGKPLPSAGHYEPSTDSINGKEENLTETKCFYPDCRTLKNFLSFKNDTGESCFLIFNNSDCNAKPFLQFEEVNYTDLADVVKSHKEIHEWSVARCQEMEEEIDSSCIIPASESGSLLTLLNALHKVPVSKKKGSQSTMEFIEMIVIVCASLMVFIALIILLILGVMLWRKKQRLRELRSRRPYSAHMNRVDNGSLSYHHQIDPVEKYDFVNEISVLNVLCQGLQSKGYEIPRENIDIGNIRDSTAQIVGVGECSIAFKGKLLPEGKTVAVKTMKSGHASARQIMETLRECKMFMKLGKHEGIVEFFGVCSEDMRRGEVYVVMEFCDNGPLKSFLIQKRNHYINLVKDGEMQQDQDLKQCAEKSIENDPSVTFNTFQLLKWCFEIANAMEFLALKKIVHRSLCTKNVMLSSNYSAKLADFHLAKILNNESISSQSRRSSIFKDRSIPWRWLAVETLVDDICLIESDIWTFGVFMWEVFTLGSTPFPEHTYGGEFAMCLKHGYRLLKPELATIECYELMLICWMDSPGMRPSITKLKDRLRSMISCYQ